MANRYSIKEIGSLDDMKEIIKKEIIRFEQYHPRIASDLKKNWTKISKKMYGAYKELNKNYEHFNPDGYVVVFDRGVIRDILICIIREERILTTKNESIYYEWWFDISQTTPYKLTEEGYLFDLDSLSDEKDKWHISWSGKTIFYNFCYGWRRYLVLDNIPTDKDNWLDEVASRKISNYENAMKILKGGIKCKCKLFNKNSTKYKTTFLLKKEEYEDKRNRYLLNRRIKNGNVEEDTVDIGRDTALKILRDIYSPRGVKIPDKFPIEIEDNDDEWWKVSEYFNKAFLIAKMIRDKDKIEFVSGNNRCRSCSGFPDNIHTFEKVKDGDSRCWYYNCKCKSCNNPVMLDTFGKPLSTQFRRRDLELELYDSNLITNSSLITN